MAQIPNIDTALLLRAASSPSIGQAIQSGTAGLKSGIDIGTALSTQKLKRKKEEQALLEEIRKATATENLAQQLESTKDIQAKREASMLTKPITLATGKEVMPQAQQTKSFQMEQEPALAAEEKQRGILGQLARISPEKAVSASLPEKGTKRYQSGTAEKDGQIINVTFDSFTGKYLDADGKDLGTTVRGYKPDIKTDPLTEELIRITTGGSVTGVGSPNVSTQMIQSPEDLTVRQSNRLNELSKRFEEDDVVKSARISMATLQNLQTVQAQGAGALIGTLQSLRARGLAGEKGVLTEKDVERTTGSPQLSRRFWNAVDKLLLGQEDPRNIAEFKSALEAVNEAATSRSRQVESEFIQRAKATKELNNVDDALIRQNISIGTKAFSPVTPDKQGIPEVGGMFQGQKVKAVRRKS